MAMFVDNLSQYRPRYRDVLLAKAGIHYAAARLKDVHGCAKWRS
jgi:hypothetical protein